MTHDFSTLSARVSDLSSRTRVVQEYNRAFNRSLADKEALLQEMDTAVATYLTRIKAIKTLSLLSEDNTGIVRDFLESVINRALSAIFGDQSYRFHLEVDREVQKVSLILSEFDEALDDWIDLDIKFNTGEGMTQVIAVLFSIVMVEVTGRRMLFLIDEAMGGLHAHAVAFIKQCVEQFASHGGQFAFIEYTFEDFGREIRVERDGSVTRVSEVVDHPSLVSV